MSPFERYSDEEPIATIDDRMLHVERVDFERGMSSVPVVSLVLIALCTAAFVAEIIKGAHADLGKMVAVGALHGPKVAQGEYWRLASAMFLHGSPDHLFGNVAMLFILGIGCEHAFGRRQFLALFVWAGLAGSLASAVAGHTSVGASGAIFGLAGAIVAFIFRHRRRLHVRDKRIAVVFLVYSAWQLILGALTPGIDNLAHLGGLAGGALIGWLLYPAVLERDQPLPWPAQAALVTAVAWLGYMTVFFLPRLL